MVRAIEAELRLASDRDRGRIDGMIDDLADRCDHLGLYLGLAPVRDPGASRERRRRETIQPAPRTTPLSASWR